jgi:Skp family chaperone for outer membrane proteins
MVSIIKRSFTIFVFAVLFPATAGSSFAQKIGVVDGNQVLTDYSVAKDADTKIKAMAQTYQDTVNMMLKARQDKFDSYKKTYDSMTKEAQDKAQAEIDKMNADAQSYYQTKLAGQESEVNKERMKLLEPIVAKIKDVITSVSKKKGLDLVIDSKQNAIYVSDKVTDITKDVSAALK